MAEGTPLPPGFVWGAATSAYQVEGAVDEGGRGESIWDRLCTVPGAIADGSTGRVACDHYHRWPADLDLVRELGLSAYRFSIAWPRVDPAGDGVASPAGLDFYERLVDGLLARGIRPFATLYHWDLPQALQDRGGWASRDVVGAFERYTELVTARLGDRVKDWMTINEPWCVAWLGHAEGHHAPALRHPGTALAVAHHLLLAHGRAVPIIRARSRGARVGLVTILNPTFPASPSEADVSAARRLDGEFNRWYLDPLYGRGYPADVRDHHERRGTSRFGFIHAGDLDTIAAPTDFLGVNYYSRAIVRSTEVPEADNAPRTLHEPPAAERTDMGWEVFPAGLREGLLRVHRDYAPESILVTENGAAYPEEPDPDGKVRDGRRRRYLHQHIAACLEARGQGVPVHGYFVWSLLDNFEWAHGYRMRFGLVHVDFATQRRTVKESGRWLAAVLSSGVLTEEEAR